MKLQTWRQRVGLTQDEFGRRIGKSQAAVARYEAGARRPARETAARIFAATGGAVTPNDFYDLPALAHARPATQEAA